MTGATHAAEMAFTFNSFANPDSQAFTFHDRNEPEVRQLAELWSGTIIAMAKTGDPNGAGLPSWPCYSSDDQSCLVLDVNPRIETGLDKLHQKLWGDT
jgi:para-nitrobenzyl esterase